MTIDINQPQIMAAVVGAIAAVIVSLAVATINQISLWRMHRNKLSFDGNLAERRAAAELALAKQKTQADIALAKRKFAIDRELDVWRRKFSLAEQLLAASYEAASTLRWARVRVTFSGEGKTRQATERESEELREARDSAFVPIERLSNNSKPFSTLQTLQDVVSAHFGPKAVQSISELLGVHRGITSAASHLVDMVRAEEDQWDLQSLMPLRDELWGERAKAADGRIEIAIQELEAICRPVLSAKAPT